MNANDFSELMRELIEDAERAVGENADDDAKGEYIVGVPTDDIGALIEYLMSISHQSIFENLITGGSGDGVSPTDLIRMTIEATVPTTWAVSRYVAKQDRKKTSSEYMAALESEIVLHNVIESGADVNKIWSADIVDHLVGTFPDPRQAFLAGVLCGKSHG